MRTTVDLPADTHARVLELARRRGRSLSATIADLTAESLSRLGEPLRIDVDPDSGFPVVRLGVVVTDADVADLLDE